MKESKGKTNLTKKNKKSLFQKKKDARTAIDNKDVHEGEIKLSLTKDQKESLKKKGNFSHSRKAKYLWRSSPQRVKNHRVNNEPG